MARAGWKTSAGAKQRVDLAVNPLGISSGGGETEKELSPKRQVVSIRLLKSIFGAEKIERLLGAVFFSGGGAIRRRAAGGHLHMRRLGLLLVLLLLQSLFIAIDYLPVTLEVLGRDRACTYLHEAHDNPTERSGR